MDELIVNCPLCGLDHDKGACPAEAIQSVDCIEFPRLDMPFEVENRQLKKELDRLQAIEAKAGELAYIVRRLESIPERILQSDLLIAQNRARELAELIEKGE